jgi:hypothetical protein
MSYVQLELFKRVNSLSRSELPPIPFTEVGGMNSFHKLSKPDPSQRCPQISRECPYVTPDCNHCLPLAKLKKELIR